MKQQLFFITLAWFTIAGAVKPGDIWNAARCNNTELAQQCIDEHGVEILERKYYTGSTPLHKVASYSNSKEIGQLFIETGGLKLLEAKDNHGNTPLHNAALRDTKEIAQLFIERGGTKLLEIKNSYGYTSLHRATAGNGSKETIQFLLSKGANISTKKGNWTLMSMIRNNDILGLLWQHRKNLNQQLLDATQKNNLEGVVQALNGGAQIDGRDKKGRTALHHATLQGNLTFIKGLLGRGADPKVYDNKGEFAVHIAVGEPERLIPFIEAAFGQRLCIKEK